MAAKAVAAARSPRDCLVVGLKSDPAQPRLRHQASGLTGPSAASSSQRPPTHPAPTNLWAWWGLAELFRLARGLAMNCGLEVGPPRDTSAMPPL
jgi:hypothetical protein